MRMQFNSFTISAMQAAFLACVVISLVNSKSPLFVLSCVACGSILVGFSNMPMPFFSVRFYASNTANSKGYEFRSARHIAKSSLGSPILLVFSSLLSAILTRLSYLKAVTANSLRFCNCAVIKNVFANPTRFSSRYLGSFGYSARQALIAFCWRIVVSNCWSWISAYGTRFLARLYTIFTDTAAASISTNSAIHKTSHTDIIPSFRRILVGRFYLEATE